MTSRERESLDRHITGNYGEDQYRGMESDPEEFTEPEECDFVTEDHRVFRVHNTGKVIATVQEDERWRDVIAVVMEEQQFFPNVWWLSDHGNYHLLSLTE